MKGIKQVAINLAMVVSGVEYYGYISPSLDGV